MDSQSTEIIGRNYLVSQLVRDGLEVARPERDRGVDLIAYLHLDEAGGGFAATPILMKAATGGSFSIARKYEKFSRMLFAHVRRVHEPKHPAPMCSTTTRRCGWPSRRGGPPPTPGPTEAATTPRSHRRGCWVCSTLRHPPRRLEGQGPSGRPGTLTATGLSSLQLQGRTGATEGAWVQIISVRRADACCVCGAALSPGDRAGWDPAGRTITCTACL
jgi:hypothetical protein